jgi:hypothetical protein
MTESWQSNSLMFGQSLVSENNLRFNSMSAQLGKYLMVTVRGRVEHGSIPPGNARYIFAIPATVIDHLNPRFLIFKRKIDKETSVIFCAVGTEFSSFIHLL